MHFPQEIMSEILSYNDQWDERNQKRLYGQTEKRRWKGDTAFKPTKSIPIQFPVAHWPKAPGKDATFVRRVGPAQPPPVMRQPFPPYHGTYPYARKADATHQWQYKSPEQPNYDSSAAVEMVRTNRRRDKKRNHAYIALY